MSQETESPKRIIAAIDVGYGQVKAVISAKPAIDDTEPQQICFPRVIAAQQGKKWSSLRTAPVYSMDDEKFIIGDDARAFRQYLLSDQAKDYIGKPTYWLAIGKAFHDMGVFNGSGFATNNKVTVKKAVLGIAPGHHTDEIEAIMKEKMLGGFDFQINDVPFSIKAEEVFLLPQGAGPYFGFLLDEQGKTHNNGNIKLSEHLYGIIDIGHETIDYVVFENKQYVTPKESPSEPNGIRYILEGLLEFVKNEFGYVDDRPEMLKDVLCGKPFVWRGKEHDLSPVVEELVKNHVKTNIVPNVTQRWQTFIGQMYKIFVCGGGASLIKKHVPDFLSEYKDQLVFCDRPELANVIGFHRYALLKDLLETQNALRS